MIIHHEHIQRKGPIGLNGDSLNFKLKMIIMNGFLQFYKEQDPVLVSREYTVTLKNETIKNT